MDAGCTSIESVAEHLAALGLGDGDTVMVHASLRALGPVEQGATGVLAAVRQAIGRRGTIVMNLGALDHFDWVNERPEDERKALLAGAEPFDCRMTPADPDVGVLAEVFRTQPDTAVSDHPDGRFGAAGPLAAELSVPMPHDDYYGPGSPLERFVCSGGKILRLGADIDTVTAIHYAEYLAPLATKRRVRRHHLVRSPSGPVLQVVECLDDSDGIRPYRDGVDYFGVILTDYLATGRATSGVVGAATSELIDAADLVGFAVSWMVANLTEE